MGFKNFREDGTLRGFLFFGAGVLCLLLAGLVVYFSSGRFVDRPSGSSAGPALSLSAPAESVGEGGEKISSGTEKKNPWVLYITGEVQSPGVYTLSPDIRIVDLVNAAGGLTSKADPVRINLAAPLSDGMHIHVSAAGVNDPEVPSVSPPESPFPSPSLSAPAEGASPERPVNINSATLEELERLPGVGPATARAILEYRRARGSFSSVEDLLGVKGIGPKKLEGMRRAVTLR